MSLSCPSHTCDWNIAHARRPGCDKEEGKEGEPVSKKGNAVTVRLILYEDGQRCHTWLLLHKSWNAESAGGVQTHGCDRLSRHGELIQPIFPSLDRLRKVNFLEQEINPSKSPLFRPCRHSQPRACNFSQKIKNVHGIFAFPLSFSKKKKRKEEEKSRKTKCKLFLSGPTVK